MAAAPPRPRRRRVLRALLAASLGLTLAFAAGEWLVRVTVGAPLAERTPLLRVEANPVRGWAMVPSEEHFTYTHRVRVNALGLRGADVPERKEPGEVRVLVLGDSLTYGQGVADEDTVPARLEAELVRRAPERTWRVVNGGLRGYDTEQELGLLEELGQRIDPDLVLLLWYWNDLEPTDIEALRSKLEASGPVAFDLDAPPDGAALRRWRWVQVVRRSALVMYLHDLWRARHADRVDHTWVRRGLERLPGELERLAAECSRLGARPVFVALPDSGALLAEHPSEPARARALAAAAEAGIPTIDPFPALRAVAEKRGRPPVIPFDGHYDVAANACIAGLIAGRLPKHVGGDR